MCYTFKLQATVIIDRTVFQKYNKLLSFKERAGEVRFWILICCCTFLDEVSRAAMIIADITKGHNDTYVRKKLKNNRMDRSISPSKVIYPA